MKDSTQDSIETMALDVINNEAVQRATNHATEKEGKIDILVNNAGVLAHGTLRRFMIGARRTCFL
jgi:NADP-dependent 3-hydroxy acid dehydrogenase YdfG